MRSDARMRGAAGGQWRSRKASHEPGGGAREASAAERALVRASLLVLLAVIMISTAFVFNTYQQQKAYEELRQLPAVKGLATNEGVISAEYVTLWEMNHDVIGWVQVTGTKIDYPVMWTPSDPEHYLRRDFRGNSSRGGTPLMSAGSSIFEPTANWLIYGHNMFDGTMFHDLVKYKDESFYKAHPTIRFDTIYEGGKGSYQVIAVVKARQGGEVSRAKNVSREFDYEQFAGVSDEVNFARYVSEVKTRSLYDTGHTAVFGDQLITLSTCEYSQKYGRLYVVAARVY